MQSHAHIRSVWKYKAYNRRLFSIDPSFSALLTVSKSLILMKQILDTPREDIETWQIVSPVIRHYWVLIQAKTCLEGDANEPKLGPITSWFCLIETLGRFFKQHDAFQLWKESQQNWNIKYAHTTTSMGKSKT